MAHMGVSADSGSASWSSVQGVSGLSESRRSPLLSSANIKIELRRTPSALAGSAQPRIYRIRSMTASITYGASSIVRLSAAT